MKYNETGITETVDIDFRKCLYILTAKGLLSISRNECSGECVMTLDIKDRPRYSSTKGRQQNISPLAACMLDLLEQVDRK